MEQIGTHEAKTRLSELLSRVRRGEEFLITNRGDPVAKLIPAAKRDKNQILLAIQQIKEIQSRNRLDGLRIKDMKEEGRS